MSTVKLFKWLLGKYLNRCTSQNAHISEKGLKLKWTRVFHSTFLISTEHTEYEHYATNRMTNPLWRKPAEICDLWKTMFKPLSYGAYILLYPLVHVQEKTQQNTIFSFCCMTPVKNLQSMTSFIAYLPKEGVRLYNSLTWLRLFLTGFCYVKKQTILTHAWEV